MLGILQMRILCTPASIPLLAAAVLLLATASFDSFGNPAYCALHDLVRGLHGD
jgi:ABC-type Fe3+ transport system permease subunit